MKEKIIKKELFCRGKILGIEKITVDLGKGKIVEWERAIFPKANNKKGRGVIVLAVDENKNILLIKKYMGAANKRMISLPMGAMKKGHSKLKTAQEELAEETGFGAKNWKYIMSLNSLPGYLFAESYFFLAQNIFKLKHPPKGDEVEYLKVLKTPLKKAIQMIKQGKITDSRTCACILYAEKFLLK